MKAKKDILVMGLGIFGFELAKQLSRQKMNVVAVDKNRNVVNQIKEFVSEAIIADVSIEDTIKELSVDKYDCVVLGLSSNFEAEVLSVVYLRKYGAKYILCKANSEIQKHVLLKIGVDEVILPETEIASKVATRIIMPSILDIFHFSDDLIVATVEVPDEFVGRSLKELDLRNRYGLTVLTLKRGDTLRIVHSPDIVFEKGDSIMVLGEEDKIRLQFKH